MAIVSISVSSAVNLWLVTACDQLGLRGAIRLWLPIRLIPRLLRVGVEGPMPVY